MHGHVNVKRNNKNSMNFPMEISTEDTKLCFTWKSWVVKMVTHDSHFEFVYFQNKKIRIFSYQNKDNILHIYICFILITDLIHHIFVPSKIVQNTSFYSLSH
jgi:hypothetical protein